MGEGESKFGAMGAKRFVRLSVCQYERKKEENRTKGKTGRSDADGK